jgi:single-stranded DNA-binding protein
MAAGDTTITMIGNLTSDPELRFTPSGAAVRVISIRRPTSGRMATASFLTAKSGVKLQRMSQSR